VEALKMLALVNGGAAVAVLTYLGNLVSHSSPGAATPDMTPALHWHCGGLLATTVAFVVAYVTQLLLYNEEIRRRTGIRVRQYHACGVCLGVMSAISAALAFGKGCMDAAYALEAVHPLIPG
jgi:hypothetical protein